MSYIPNRFSGISDFLANRQGGGGGPIAMPFSGGPQTAFSLNPSPPIAAPGILPQTGGYYPGAAGAPSGITQMTPGVQAVSGAIGNLPGVNPGPGPHYPDKPDFDHAGYAAAMQSWQGQRMTPPGQGADAAAFDAWRQGKPDRHAFIGAPGA